MKREGIPAAERRRSVATAEGRGSRSGLKEPQRGERFFRPCLGSRVDLNATTALLAASRYRAAVATLLRRSAA